MPGSPVQCRRCQQWGHYARECTAPRPISAIEDGELVSGVIALLTTEQMGDTVLNETFALDMPGLARARHEAFAEELAEARLALFSGWTIDGANVNDAYVQTQAEPEFVELMMPMSEAYVLRPRPRLDVDAGRCGGEWHSRRTADGLAAGTTYRGQAWAKLAKWRRVRETVASIHILAERRSRARASPRQHVWSVAPAPFHGSGIGGQQRPDSGGLTLCLTQGGGDGARLDVHKCTGGGASGRGAGG